MLTSFSSVAILRHLDANKRQELHQRCPSMRGLNSELPLKYERIHLHPYTIQINDTSYNLGVVTQYRRGIVPDQIESINNSGGVQDEVDQFGFPMKNLEEMPDDIRVEAWEGPGTISDLESDFRNLEAEQQQLTWKLDRVEDWQREQVEKKLGQVTAHLLPHILRRDMSPAIPYHHLIRLTITDGKSKTKAIETINYNLTTLASAMKYLQWKLLSWHSLNCHVAKLGITPREGAKSWFRLPMELTFSGMKQLKIDRYVQQVLNSFARILILNNVKLDVLELGGSLRTFQNFQLIENAQKVIFTEIPPFLDIKINKNRRIHFETQHLEYVELREVIDSWKEKGKNAGTHYSFLAGNKEHAEMIWAQTWSSEGVEPKNIDGRGCPGFPDCLKIEMPNKNELIFDVERTKKFPIKYIFNLRVQKVNGTFSFMKIFFPF